MPEYHEPLSFCSFFCLFLSFSLSLSLFFFPCPHLHVSLLSFIFSPSLTPHMSHRRKSSGPTSRHRVTSLVEQLTRVSEDKLTNIAPIRSGSSVRSSSNTSLKTPTGTGGGVMSWDYAGDVDPEMLDDDVRIRTCLGAR